MMRHLHVYIILSKVIHCDLVITTVKFGTVMYRITGMD